MKAPICDICLKSSILCPVCQKNIDSGKVKEDDVNMYKRLFSDPDVSNILNEIDIKNILNMDGLVIIICSKGDSAKLVGRGGSVVKKLNKIFDKTVRIVEASEDPRTFLQNFIFPTPILSLNMVYENGTEKYMVKIPRDKRLPIPKDVFLRVSKNLLGKDVEIDWDGEPPKKETTEEKIKKLLNKMDK